MRARLFLSPLLGLIFTPPVLTPPVLAASLCEDAKVFASGFHAQRTRIACEAKQAIESSYVLAYQKEKRITEADGSPFRTRRHLEACVVEEYGNPDEDSPETRIAFYDRLRACIAGFQDTHLEITPSAGLPWVTLGFSLREVNGAFHIDSMNPRLVTAVAARLQEPGITDRIVPGARVLAIDGLSIEAWLEKLQPYVAASSAEYRRMETLNRVTSRSFVYPNQALAGITIAREDGSDPLTIPLPWSADLSFGLDPAATLALEARGFKHEPLIPWIDQPVGAPSAVETPLPEELLEDELKKLEAYAGYYDDTPAVPETAAARIREFPGFESGSPVLAYVRVDAKRDGVEKPYCYLQLASFNEDKLPGFLRRFKKDYATPMRKFLRQCRRDDLPLVLDLRTNPGGYLTLGTQTVSALTPRGELFGARSTWAYRDDPVYQEVDGAYFDGQYWGDNTIEASPREKHDRRVGGFDGKVVALITPYCISSCDRLAAMLKAGQRATLVGSPTNGTGAGFQDTMNPLTGKMNSEWTDSYGLLSMQIPDMLFGALRDNGAPVKYSPEGFGDWWWWFRNRRPESATYPSLPSLEGVALLENRPTLPDVPYAPTLGDLRGETNGWIDVIQKVL